MSDVMNSGALGIEILITGKIPSSRARRWRFYQGYLKKCGDVAIEGVRKSYAVAHLKTGSVGIQVRIMPPDIILPDRVIFTEETETAKEIVKDMKKDDKKKDNTNVSKVDAETKDKKDEKAKSAKTTKKEEPVKKEATKEPVAEKKAEKKEEQAEKPASEETKKDSKPSMPSPEESTKEDPKNKDE